MDIQPEVILEEPEGIRKALRQFSRGWNNQTAVDQIGAHLSAIESASSPGHGIRDKVAIAYGWVTLLYSPRVIDEYGSTDDMAISRFTILRALKRSLESFFRLNEICALQQIPGTNPPKATVTRQQ